MKSDFNHLKAAAKVCKGKPCYSKKLAETIKNRRGGRSDKSLRIYQCPSCNGWHLSHNNGTRY